VFLFNACYVKKISDKVLLKLLIPKGQVMETTFIQKKTTKGPVLLDASFAGMILLLVVPAVVVGLIIFFITLPKKFKFDVFAMTSAMAILFLFFFGMFNWRFYPGEQIKKQYKLANAARNEYSSLQHAQDRLSLQFQEGKISKEKFDERANEIKNEIKTASSHLNKTQYDDLKKIKGDYAKMLFRFILILNILTLIMAFVVRRNKTLMISLLLFSVLLLIFNYTNDFLINPFA